MGLISNVTATDSSRVNRVGESDIRQLLLFIFNHIFKICAKLPLRFAWGDDAATEIGAKWLVLRVGRPKLAPHEMIKIDRLMSKELDFGGHTPPEMVKFVDF